MRSRAHFILTGLSGLALGSCSYAYNLRAVAIDGRLAFIVDPTSDRKPDCVRSIEVSVDEGGPIALSAAGDDEKLVRNGGVYWWKVFDASSCPNRFPIFYGQRLKGVPFVYDDGRSSSVEAKPLRLGVLYSVLTTSSGSGAGEVWFRIDKNGHIENFREDPSPAIINEEGYDVTDYANMAKPANEGTYYPSAR